MKLVRESFTRVTLALDIVGKIAAGSRAGYHELGTIKHQIDLSDTVTVEDAPHDTLECDDPAVPCDSRNVCLAAAALVRKYRGIDRGVRITIGKRIPVMGGLAGGSTNAATTILLLNELWGLSLSREELVTLGREIGMDVPFYFVGNTAFDSEAGLRLEPIATTSSFDFVLACPEFGVSTREAYAGIDYSVIGSKAGLTESMRAAFLAGNCAGVVSCMHNDFEYSVFQRNPRLALIKQELQDAGCLGAMMTGSGSTVIGIAQNAVHAESVRKRISCRTIISKTKKPEAI